MLVFIYDRSFEGLLTVIFEAFRCKIFPEALITLDDEVPLLASRVIEVPTDQEKAGRVWAGLEKKLSAIALKQIIYA